VAGTIALIILAIFALWVIVIFNGLVVLKNQTINGWHQIDVQLKRRYDLIPNLVEVVKGYMQHEQQTLQLVVEARQKAISAGSLSEKNLSENALTGALKQLFALVENYPQLKANENCARLQEELVSTENRLGFARQFYNDIATRFNIRQQMFPANIIAGVLGFKPVELFGIQESAERQVPKVF
jgi:LemA protein